MDVLAAIKERRSCRDFLAEPVSEEAIEQILEAATWAPSPLNMQGWEFIVIIDQEVKEKIYSEAERCRKWALEKSGWKWLGGYKTDFLRTAPVIITVVGNPQKSGVDVFMEGGPLSYEHACAAAIQNMHLAAHTLGVASLWFTFYDRNNLRDILAIDPQKAPVGLVCIGKAASKPQQTPRKPVSEKTTYMR